MRTKQALVAVGGKGGRLKAGGVDVPVAKSFLEIEGRALLYWCLHGLYFSGITKLVIVGNGVEKIIRAKEIVQSLPFNFEDVVYLEDPGFNTTCKLPYFARDYLDDRFIFEFGHSMNTAEHYQAMDAAKDEDCIVFSAYKNQPGEPRHPICVNVDPQPVELSSKYDYDITAPYLFDKTYLSKLPDLNFRTDEVIKHYCRNKKLRIVKSVMPMEINDAQEYRSSIPVYINYVKNILVDTNSLT